MGVFGEAAVVAALRDPPAPPMRGVEGNSAWVRPGAAGFAASATASEELAKCMRKVTAIKTGQVTNMINSFVVDEGSILADGLGVRARAV